jgi:four helix bundle protein
MVFMFEKLQVYQKAVDFADEVAGFSEGFPRGYGFLSDQLNRAALSVATNLAEGNGRFTKADRKNFFMIARGSVQECVPLLEVARRRGLLDKAQHSKLLGQIEAMGKMIGGLIRGMDKRQP